VLEALGSLREVEEVELCSDRGWLALAKGPLDGWASDSFPSIHNINIALAVLEDLEPAAAAERIPDGISSIVGGVRGLVRLTVDVFGPWGADQSDEEAFKLAIQQLLLDGTRIGDNFTISNIDKCTCMGLHHQVTASRS